MPILRITVFGGIYIGSPYFGKLPIRGPFWVPFFLRSRLFGFETVSQDWSLRVVALGVLGFGGLGSGLRVEDVLGFEVRGFRACEVSGPRFRV